MPELLYKFGTPASDDSTEVSLPYDYGNRFFVQPCGDTERIVLGPSEGAVATAIDLAYPYRDGDWMMLYVLCLSRRGDNEPGRYESPAMAGLDAVSRFLAPYLDFLDQDGRHHFWLHGVDVPLCFVCDQHDLVFVYGETANLASRLAELGWREEEFWIPGPHCHHYHPEHDEQETELLKALPWKRSDLQRQDIWD